MDEDEEIISYTSTNDDLLINQVNNRNVTVNLKLDDLFTKVGQRIDFRPPSKTIIPKRFDMGYDDILFNEVNNIDVPLEEDLDDLFAEIRSENDEENPVEEIIPNDETNPEDTESQENEDLSLFEYDDILINPVNNEDKIIEQSLDELFTEIGPRVNFLLDKKPVKPVIPQEVKPNDGSDETEYPPGYSMSPNNPPPFKRGYNTILINKVNNREANVRLKLNDLFPEVGPRVDFKKSKCRKAVIRKPPPPFNIGSSRILINNANNEDVRIKENICELLTKIGPKDDFQSGKKQKGKLPRGYAMNPNWPPPFNKGSDAVLINEANNEDVRIKGKFKELFTTIGHRVDFKKEKLK